MKTQKLKAAPGRLVMHPLVHRALNPKGEVLTLTPAVMRQIEDGDLVPADNKKPAKKSASKE